MRSSIHDVAKRAGVSISTVSRVINRSAGVKESKVKAVLEAMEYYNYEPNQFGRGLVKQTSNMIGVYFPYSSISLFDNTYFLELLKGMERVITEYNYSLLLLNENESYEKSESTKPKFQEYINQNRIDGLILSSVPEDPVSEFSLNKFLDQNFPIAYVGKRFHENGFNVYAQYETYMCQMFEELYRNGHRRILVFLYIHQVKIFNHVKDMIVQLWPDLNLHVKLIANEKPNKIMRLIVGEIEECVCKKNYTAICSMTIEYASMILGACNELKLCVPEDVSIISVEHKKGDGRLLYPAVSAFYVPALEMGDAIAKMLLRYLRGEEVTKYSKEFETSYIRRESVKNID